MMMMTKTTNMMTGMSRVMVTRRIVSVKVCRGDEKIVTKNILYYSLSMFSFSVFESSVCLESEYRTICVRAVSMYACTFMSVYVHVMV